MDYERCTISVSSVTITNSIRTLKYDDHIKINNEINYINNHYINLNPGTFSVVLDELLPVSYEMHLDYCNRIYFQSYISSFIIQSMSSNLSILRGIKLFQVPITSVEIENLTNNEEEEEILETIHIIKIYQYGDYNSTPIFYLMSNLGANFFVQTSIDDKEELKDILINHNIFMRITNSFLPDLLITYTGEDYKNDCFISSLTSTGYIELLDSNLQAVDLLYPLRLSLLIEFY
jgi:hypothetical protein